MKQGILLTVVERDAAWKKLKIQFSFDPILQQQNMPLIHTTADSHKFSIEHFWGDAEDHKIPKFLQKAIDAFVDITPPGEKIYALDWQHDCFLVDPRQLTVRDMVDTEQAKFLVSFIPENSYTVFITQRFENAWFADPFERAITLVGKKLIKTFK